MRIFFAAGGTAGHVNPALAIAQYIQAQDKTSSILFAAAEGGMEKALVETAGFETVPLRVRGLRHGFSLKNVGVLFDAWRAVGHAEYLLRRFEPDVVLGTGGYLSYPVLQAARRLRMKRVLHESNAIPGLVAKVLGPHMDSVLLSFKSAKECFSKKTKCYFTGTPLREDFARVNRQKAREELGIKDGELLLLSFGGSLGADEINRLALKLMYDGGLPPYVRVIHATGRRNYDRVMLAMSEHGLEPPAGCRVLPYIDPMSQAMAAADLVISRAGALTVSELARLGRASILIPFPGATRDHQTKNAAALAALGGCSMLQEGPLAYDTLREEVFRLLLHPTERHRMESAALGSAPKNPEALIYTHLQSLVSNSAKI